MDWIKKLDFELLQKRYEKMQERRALESDDASCFGIGYAYVIDGRVYPVCAMFPMGDYDEAHEKIKYLISGGKP